MSYTNWQSIRIVDLYDIWIDDPYRVFPEKMSFLFTTLLQTTTSNQYQQHLKQQHPAPMKEEEEAPTEWNNIQKKKKNHNCTGNEVTRRTVMRKKKPNEGTQIYIRSERKEKSFRFVGEEEDEEDEAQLSSSLEIKFKTALPSFSVHSISNGNSALLFSFLK